MLIGGVSSIVENTLLALLMRITLLWDAARCATAFL
jgi:hypothetical protein